MSMTEKAAIVIGNKAKEFLKADSDEVDIIVYGAINLMQLINSILWVAIIGFITGTLYEALLFSTTASILRKCSGGVHASSPINCIIIGVITAVGSGIFTDRIFYKANLNVLVLFSIISMCVSLFIIIKNAPVDSVQKPITENEMKKNFKRKSILIIIINIIIIISLFVISQRYNQLFCIVSIESISMGVLWQSITLTKFGAYLVTKIDSLLGYILR